MSVFVSTDVTSGARPSIPALVALSVAGSVVLFLVLSVSDTVLALLILRSVLAELSEFRGNNPEASPTNRVRPLHYKQLTTLTPMGCMGHEL